MEKRIAGKSRDAALHPGTIALGRPGEVADAPFYWLSSLCGRASWRFQLQQLDPVTESPNHALFIQSTGR